mgnify:CR=1 FL=1|jgi:hypothetical protein
MIKQNEPFRQIQVQTCPVCGHKINLAMKVNSDTPGQPSHIFWGPPDGRRRVCSAGAWFHFIADVDGEEVHRLAYLMKRALGPGDPVRPAPEDSPVQLTLGGGIMIPQQQGKAN